MSTIFAVLRIPEIKIRKIQVKATTKHKDKKNTTERQNTKKGATMFISVSFDAYKAVFFMDECDRKRRTVRQQFFKLRSTVECFFLLQKRVSGVVYGGQEAAELLTRLSHKIKEQKPENKIADFCQSTN